MKKNAYPRYLDALLVKHLAPDNSKSRLEAIRYIEKINKKIEKGNSKTSDKV
jgi:hypothetical protein